MFLLFIYFLDLPINHNTKATTITIPITPVHIPALKIPPIASQLDNVIVKIAKKATREIDKRFIKNGFSY